MYFDISSVMWFTLFASIIFYCVQAIRNKEIAIKAAEKHCNTMQVQFLDQTVFLKKLRLKRNTNGHLRLVHQYSFEFTVSGEDRYVGHLFLSGIRIESINLDPHRIPDIRE